MYPKQLFVLQVEFALFLAGKHGLSLKEALFQNTAIYTRILGHNDAIPPFPENPLWLELLAGMPGNKSELADYFFEKYQFAENKRITTKPTEAKLLAPCFHTYYHESLNKYELHLDVNDKNGVLAKSRITARVNEIKALLDQIKKDGKYDQDTMFFVRTWLLHIEAFVRLFPTEFINSAVVWDNNNKTQDNSYWGQFIDKEKKFKEDMAMRFREKMAINSFDDFNLYFPYPALHAQINVSSLIKDYDQHADSLLSAAR